MEILGGIIIIIIWFSFLAGLLTGLVEGVILITEKKITEI